MRIMRLMLFWINVIFKRVLSLFKTSPVMVIWIFVIIGAFIFAAANRHLVIKPDNSTLVIVTLLLALFSVLASFKNYDTIPVLTLYSKSNIANKYILAGFFLKKAFINNILLIIFCILALDSASNIFLFLVFIGVPVFFIFLAFLIMYKKNNYANNQSIKKEKRALRMNPYIKTIIYDYLTPDFFALFALCVSLFIVITAEYTGNFNSLLAMKNQITYFIIVFVLFSAGFSGIIESIQNINWKYQAIITENSFKYHYKRTLHFIALAYGLLLAVFIIMGCLINPFLMFKYVFCIFIIMFSTINIAFTAINKLIKTVILCLLVVSTAWIGTLPVFYMPLSAIPVLITFIKAKNEYREWYLL